MIIKLTEWLCIRHLYRIIFFKQRERRRCPTRTSRWAAAHAWFCSNGPIGEYAIRRESVGTWRHDPFGCAPNAS